MNNNIDFSNDLKLEYLNLLAKYGYDKEFSESYSKLGGYLADRVDTTTDVAVLTKLRNIIEYRKEHKEGMIK